MSGTAVADYLDAEGLLDEVDPSSHLLPLSSGGRAEFRAVQRAATTRRVTLAAPATPASLAAGICHGTSFRWGEVLALTRILRQRGVAAVRAEAPDRSGELATAAALARLLDPGLPEQSVAATRRARRLLRAKCRGLDGIDVLRAFRVALSSDGVVRGREDWGPAARAITPDAHLAALVDTAADGRFDRAAFTTLDRALRDDALGPDERTVLPLIAGLLDNQDPPHPMGGLVVGFARKQRVTGQTAEAITAVMEEGFSTLGIPTVVVGDLAAARRWYPDPATRATVRTQVLVPAGTSRRSVRTVVAQAVRTMSGEVVGRGGSAVSKFGTTVGAGVIVAPQFGFPSATEAFWGSGRGTAGPPPDAVLLYHSVVSSMLGAPRMRWYADAVGMRRMLGSEEAFAAAFRELDDAAEAFGWRLPVRLAREALRSLGWSVPEPSDIPERRLDRAYWLSRSPDGPFARGTADSPSVQAARRVLLAARLAAHGAGSLGRQGPGSAAGYS